MLLGCWWEFQLVQSLWITVWKFLRKLEIELLYGPIILLLGIYRKIMKPLIQKYTCILMFIAELFKIAKMWKQLVSTDGRMDEEDIPRLYTMEYYSAIKQNILLFEITWINLKGIMLSEISETQTDIDHRISLTYRMLKTISFFTLKVCFLLQKSLFLKDTKINHMSGQPIIIE